MVRPTTPPVLRDAYVRIHKAYTTVIDLNGKYLSQIHETIKFIPELEAIKAFLMNRDLRSDKSFFDEKFIEIQEALNRSKLMISQIIEDVSTTKGIAEENVDEIIVQLDKLSVKKQEMERIQQRLEEI